MSLFSGYVLSFLAASQIFIYSVASAADIRWIGPSAAPSGNWSDPANWDTGTVPGPNDRAILTGGAYTVTLDVSATIAGILIGDPGAIVGAQTLRILADRTLTVTGAAELNGSATLTIEASGIVNNDGGTQWAGGTINGPGTINNNGDCIIAAGGFQTLTNGAIFNNAAQITITSTDFRGGGGSVLTNFSGASVIVEDGTVARFAFVSGPQLVLVNQGILAKRPGSGMATWGVGFNLEGGLVDVPQGTLVLSGGGISKGGTIDVAPGASLDFTGARHIFSGSYSGSTDGLITLDHSIDPAGATFDFQGNGFNWHAGTLIGPGNLVNTGVLNILPDAFQIMTSAASIDNGGTVHFASTDFRGGGGSVIKNLQGGVFVVHDDAVGRFAFVSGPALTLTNQGVFIKPTGPGTTTWGLGFDQAGGTIDVQEGSVALSGGGNSQDGMINVAPAATLDLRGQFHNFSGTYTGITDGRVLLFTTIDPAGATFNFQQGGFNWYGGTLRGPGTLTNNGILNIMAGDFQVMKLSAAIDNAGTVNFSSSDFRGGGSSVITNLADGTFVLMDDALGRFAFVSGPPLSLVNRGIVARIKSPGVANWALTFNNEGGTIDVPDGTLLLSGGGISKDGNLKIGLTGTLDLSGAVHTFSGAFSGTTDGRLVLNTRIDVDGATFDFSVGGLIWHAGRVTGPGRLTNNGILNMPPGAAQEITSNALIDNAGTINISSTDLRGGGGSILTNLSSGSIVFKDNALARFAFLSGPALTLVNQGAVVKDQGAGAANWGLFFNNEGGFIDVQAGALNFSGGGTSTGGNFFVAANAMLDFSGTVHTFSGIYSGSTSGNVILNSAIDNAGATFEFFDGGINWYGGTLTGPGTLTNLGSINIIPGSFQAIAGNVMVENQGGINLSSTDLRGGGGAIINNRNGGSFSVATNASALFVFLSGPALTFNNEGRFVKEDALGTTTWGLPFINTGIVEARAGMIEFTGGYVQHAGDLILDGGNISSTAAIDIRGGRLAGSGTVFADVINGGEVSPGGFLDTGATGIMNVDGNYTQLGLGSLNIDIGGLIGGSELDQLAISEDATLAGMLNVNAFSIVSPLEMSQFMIMTYRSRTGTFDQFNGLDSGGLVLTPNFTPTALVLESKAPGDLTVTPQILD
ncbi:hypothetical protein MJD09_12350, partial [bacterium]|nr:hypothetical protein [bacterium]